LVAAHDNAWTDGRRSADGPRPPHPSDNASKTVSVTAVRLTSRIRRAARRLDLAIRSKAERFRAVLCLRSGSVVADSYSATDRASARASSAFEYNLDSGVRSHGDVAAGLGAGYPSGSRCGPAIRLSVLASRSRSSPVPRHRMRCVMVSAHLVARDRSLAARSGRYIWDPVPDRGSSSCHSKRPRSPASHPEAAAQSDELGCL